MVPEGLDHIMHIVVPVFFVEKDPSFQQPYRHGHCGRRAEARQFFATRCHIVQGEQMFFVRRVVWFCGRQVHGGAPPHVFRFAVGAFRLAFTIIPTHSDALKNIGNFPPPYLSRNACNQDAGHRGPYPWRFARSQLGLSRLYAALFPLLYVSGVRHPLIPAVQPG